ncbi:MAG: MATE family efflux transporter [Leptolyngbya sp. SIOISBB]|nr:MATE family efflux transporter [Leptolyngbya sp. SIOISBB]
MKVFAISPATQSEIREFLKLALPLASAQVAQALTGFVDTLMMGRLGQEALAAGGLAVMIFMATLMTGVGIVSSVSPLAAQAYGAQRPEQVGQVTRQGLWLALLIAVPVVPFIGNLGDMMRSLGQAPEVITLADSYLSVICWACLPALWFAVLRCTVTALARTRPIFVIMVGANILNVLGNYVLAFGKLGFPAMGLSGLAIASALSHSVMCLGLMGYVIYHRRGFLQPYRLFERWLRLRPAILKQLLVLGFPIGVVTILENGLFTVMTLMVGAIGTHVLAAQQLALQTVVIVFMLPLGMSYAATARVGQWYGRGDWPGVQRAAMVSVSLTVAVMFIFGGVFVLFPTPLISLYLDVNDPANQAVLQAGIAMLTVAGFGQVVDGVQRTANGVLQGLQDTRVPMVLSLIAYWGVGMVSGYWLGFQTPLGGVGIWIGAYLGLATAAISYIWRFRMLLKTR